MGGGRDWFLRSSQYAAFLFELPLWLLRS